MAWFWSDDLARLLIERDGVAPESLADWISGPTAHRSDLSALELARQLFGEPATDAGSEAASPAA